MHLSLKEDSPTRDEGRKPVKLLEYRCITLKEDSPPRDEGRKPVKLLEYRYIPLKEDSPPRDEGREPVKLLEYRYITLKEDSPPRDEGREPLKLLEFRYISLKEDSPPRDEGRKPVKLLESRYITLKEDSPPRDEGREPVNDLLLNDKLTTLPPLQATPVQEHTLTVGVLPVQFQPVKPLTPPFKPHSCATAHIATSCPEAVVTGSSAHTLKPTQTTTNERREDTERFALDAFRFIEVAIAIDGVWVDSLFRARSSLRSPLCVQLQ